VQKINRIGVIGGGLMGHGIALEFAVHGYTTTLQSRSQDSLDRAREMVVQSAGRLVELGKLDESKAAVAPDLIAYTTDLSEACSEADIVVESVYEDLETKRDLFRQLDTVCPEHTILASNTSAIMPSKLAKATTRPDRVINIHYLNPPHIAPFVEVVPAPTTSDATSQRVMDLMASLGKRAILLNHEVEGFVASRLQGVLLREALWLVENDVASAVDVDTAISAGLGRRWSAAGVMQVLEFAGWDLLYGIAQGLFPHLSTETDSRVLREMVERGELGVKTGKGFYDWTPEHADEVRGRIAKALIGDDSGTSS